MGYIYIVQPACLVGTTPCRYKIGMTEKDTEQRLKDYNSGTIRYFLYPFDNSLIRYVENKIKILFSIYFTRIGGSEIFEGNIQEMCLLASRICTDVFNDEYLLKPKTNLNKELFTKNKKRKHI
jgi:hypothetical protein